MSANDSHWIFGYGSLIFKVDFPVLEQQPAALDGWSRRFWQGSHDHRGTPDAPGRVVTLIRQPGERCLGIAYRITEDVFEHLDYREKDGYARHKVRLTLTNDRCVSGIVYVATPENPSFLGDAPSNQLAGHIARSCGPSGSNLEYFVKLRAALVKLGDVDQHIEEIAEHLTR